MPKKKTQSVSIRHRTFNETDNLGSANRENIPRNTMVCGISNNGLIAARSWNHLSPNGHPLMMSEVNCSPPYCSMSNSVIPESNYMGGPYFDSGSFVARSRGRCIHPSMISQYNRQHDFIGRPFVDMPRPSNYLGHHSLAGKLHAANRNMIFSQANPNGPPIYPCGICRREVHDSDQGVFCESGCGFWYHRACTGLTEAAYAMLRQEVYAEWACDMCLSTRNIPPIKLKL